MDTEFRRDEPVFEKVDVTIEKLKVGEELVGTLTAISDRPWVDRKTGEMKTIKQFHITGRDGNKMLYFADAGFQNCMSMSDIQIGDLFKAVKLEKATMEGGRSVNQYEIYKAKTRN